MNRQKVYEYIVIGSGPGGATIAKELSLRQKEVCIVEFGNRIEKTGFLKVGPMISTDREETNSPSAVSISSARVLGGSSYIATGSIIDPIKNLQSEWGVCLDEEIDFAKEELRVSPVPIEMIGEGTKRINEAIDSLGWVVKPIPKCIDFNRCVGCGQCMYGCPNGAKWTAVNAVDEAVENGAELRLNTEVKRILHNNGVAYGVLVVKRHKEQIIQGNTVILCAGALNTPRLLQASGISEAGRRLAADIFQTTYGFTDHIGMQHEIVMAFYSGSHEKKELFLSSFVQVPYLILRDIENCSSIHSMSKLRKLGFLLRSRRIEADRLIGILTKIGDDPSGEVIRDGGIWKTLTERDEEKLAEGYEINRKILIKAGADPKSIFRGIYEGVHPCCTAAIGRVVNINLETQIRNLFVSDASIFPKPLGVPPILTIIAFSKRLAKYLTANR